MLKKSQSKLSFRYLLQYIFSVFHGWRKLDWLLLLLVVGLTGFGTLTIHSIQFQEQTNYTYHHLSIGLIGLGLVFAIANISYRVLLLWYWIIYAITNISLIAVIIGGVTANGAQRWLNIGGFNLQPSEFAKIGVVITLAALLHDRNKNNPKTIFRALAITAVPWCLVFLQPDLGTSLVFGVIVFTMLYWAKVNPGWLVLIISPLLSLVLYNLHYPSWLVWMGILLIITWLSFSQKIIASLIAIIINCGAIQLGTVFWGLLKDYQKDRIILFLNPEKDPFGGGYHLIQSRIAIGSGGLWGNGLYQGSQTQLNFIPEQHTDFIFSAVGEEWGFIGCAILILVYWLIAWRLIHLANNARDNFGSLLAIGVFAIIVFQVILNISMTIGLAPITGIPLPWMSYGRSSLLTNFIAIAIVESVANYRAKEIKRY